MRPNVVQSVVTFVIPGNPVGAVRMNRSVRFKKSDAQLRYFAWKDYARLLCPRLLVGDVIGITLAAYFSMPESWSAKKKAEMRGTPHRVKPDGDNIEKALMDALLAQDQRVCQGSWKKFWDDGGGPRLEVALILSNAQTESKSRKVKM